MNCKGECLSSETQNSEVRSRLRGPCFPSLESGMPMVGFGQQSEAEVVFGTSQPDLESSGSLLSLLCDLSPPGAMLEKPKLQGETT